MIREFQVRQQLGFINGVHFPDLLDLLPRLFQFLSPSRSSRLRGEKTLQRYCEDAQITQSVCKG